MPAIESNPAVIGRVGRTRSPFATGHSIPVAAIPVGAAIAGLVIASSAEIGGRVPLLAAVAVVLLAVGALWPVGVLVAALLAIPLETIALPLTGFSLTPGEGLFVAVGAGWAVAQLGRGQSLITASPLLPPLSLLILAIVPGLLVAIEPFAVLKQLGMWTAFFLVFQMIVTTGDTRLVRTVLMALAMAGAILGTTAVIDSFGTDQQLIGFGEIATGRAQGTLSHPSALGLFLVLGIAALLALVASGPRALRPIALLATAICVAGIGLSLSRAAFLGLAAVALILMSWGAARRVVLVAVAVLAALSVTGHNPAGFLIDEGNVTARITSAFQEAGSSTDPRNATYHAIPEIVADHPVFGVGAHSFPDVAPYYGLIDPRSRLPIGHAHSTPLAFLTELGVLGLLAFLWFTVVIGRMLLRTCSGSRGTDRAMAYALAAAFFGVLLHGLADYAMQVNVIAATVFTLAGCVVVLDRKVRSATGHHLRA